MFTSIYCGQVYNIYNYTKQHLYIYTCTRVYINIYMYIQVSHVKNLLR